MKVMGIKAQNIFTAANDTNKRRKKKYSRDKTVSVILTNEKCLN